MKAIFLMLSATLGCYVTLLNMEHLAAVQKQINTGLPAALPKLADNDNNTPSDDATPPVNPLTSVSDLTRLHGEPTRTERISDGTTVYYYPYYIVYVRNYIVISSRRIGAQPPTTAQTGPNTTAGRFWGSSSLNGTTTDGRGTAPATTNPGWQGHTNSLGSVSLNGSGVSRPATTNPGWQAGGASLGTVTAPRTVSAPRTVVHQSSGSAMYRSGGGYPSGSSGQWAH